MSDLRERLVRIETKMDAGTAAALILTAKVEHSDLRIDALDSAHVALKSTVKTLAWVGGAMLTIVSLFGNGILHYVQFS